MISSQPCRACGAPNPSEAIGCGWCDVATTRASAPLAAPAYRDPDDPGSSVGDSRVVIGERAFRLRGRLARGERCDVFLAERDARLTELVVVKAARDAGAADALAREWRTLRDLQGRDDVQGASHFTTLLPQPVAHDPSRRGAASLFRWRSGFVHTFDDVICEHPAGVAPQTAIWMWKRILGLLGWVHRAGYVHDAVVPAHLLVHARDHGVVLVGWSRAVRLAADPTTPRAAEPESARVYYPIDSGAPPPPSRATDIAMSARCVLYVLGGDPASGAMPTDVPAPLADLIRDHAALDDGAARRSRAPSDDAWELLDRVGRAGHAAFGAARYHPFRMPGWR